MRKSSKLVSSSPLKGIKLSPPSEKKRLSNANLTRTTLVSSNQKRERFPSAVLSVEEIKKKLLAKKSYLCLETFNTEYPDFSEAYSSKKPFSSVKAFAMNTYKGITRNYNEDKILGKVNIEKPPENKSKVWPKISFFGVFDGHGGNYCSEFLHRNLLHYILTNKNFPINPKEAILQAFTKAEHEFMSEVVENKDNKITIKDDSGSCACMALIVDSQMYIANLGDSRAIMSYDEGKKIKQLTVDHKPNDPKEKKRIIENGGEVYFEPCYSYELDLTQGESGKKTEEINDDHSFSSGDDVEDGIYRVNPGKLAVSRSIGDFSCKLKETGGNPNIIICTPDVTQIPITSNCDFLLIGCDGIFDVFSSEEAIEAAWYADNYCKSFRGDLNKQCSYYADNVIKSAMKQNSTDNLSCIIVGLNNLESITNHKLIKDKVHKAMKINDIKKEEKKSIDHNV